MLYSHNSVHSSSYIYYISLSCKAGFCYLIIGTGTGKMLSFALPFLEKLSAEEFTRNDQGRPPLVFTMTSTGELTIQVFRK